MLTVPSDPSAMMRTTPRLSLTLASIVRSVPDVASKAVPLAKLNTGGSEIAVGDGVTSAVAASVTSGVTSWVGTSVGAVVAASVGTSVVGSSVGVSVGVSMVGSTVGTLVSGG